MMIEILDLTLTESMAEMGADELEQIRGGGYTSSAQVALSLGPLGIQNNGGNVTVSLIPGQLPSFVITHSDGTSTQVF